MVVFSKLCGKAQSLLHIVLTKLIVSYFVLLRHPNIRVAFVAALNNTSSNYSYITSCYGYTHNRGKLL